MSNNKYRAPYRALLLGAGLIVGGLSGIAVDRAGAADADVILKRSGDNCAADPNCFNRLHPDVPPVAHATPGQTILFETRNAGDLDLDSASLSPRPGTPPAGGVVHPLSGPVYIDGAKAGDVLAVELLDVHPGPYGYTSLIPIGLIADRFPGVNFAAIWKLTDKFAETPKVPGVRIPYAAFPGVLTVLPGKKELATALAREKALAEAGGAVRLPDTNGALPAALCGEGAPLAARCLRTIPPREHGGNTDIRYYKRGVTVYLPCQIDGCGLAVGDVHYAQGDAEVSGTAIEMDSTIIARVSILKDRPAMQRGPHFSGASELLDIPSRHFYAVTGFPWKRPGEVPPDMAYLNSPKVAPLVNLSKDITLAARNALLEMIDYMVATRGLSREQAYLIASVAVDLRIAQLVDAPNVGVIAVLPTDIFSGR